MRDSKLSQRHLLGIKNITPNDIELIFDTADFFKDLINRPVKQVAPLRDVTIANVFFENSTRTRLSFELAQKRLSAGVINFAASNSSVKKGETLLDTVNNILAMKVDMIVIRHASVGAPHFLAKHIKANIVNAGDGTHEHPTQALLDAYSIREKLGDVGGKKVAIIGDILHSRVALSNIFALQKLGAKVMVCGPPTLLPKFISSLGVQVELDVKKSTGVVRCCECFENPARKTAAKIFSIAPRIHFVLRHHEKNARRTEERDRVDASRANKSRCRAQQ